MLKIRFLEPEISPLWPLHLFSGHMEIHPCVLQDIGPLGPLPCSHSTILKQQQSRASGTADHMRSLDDLLFLSSPAALDEGSWKDIQALYFQRRQKIAKMIIRFWSFFPTLSISGSIGGPLDGSLKGPWPFILFSYTRWQYLYIKFSSPIAFEKKQPQNSHDFGHFQLFWSFGGPLRTPGGPPRDPTRLPRLILCSTTYYLSNKTNPKVFYQFVKK